MGHAHGYIQSGELFGSLIAYHQIEVAARNLRQAPGAGYCSGMTSTSLEN